MKKAIPTIIVALALAAPLSAQQVMRRTAGGGGPEAGPGAVPVPRHPYAGNWDGTLTIDGGSAAAKIAMSFSVADAERQSYNGETTINGRAQAHMKISAAPAGEAQSKTTDAPIMRRSSGGGQAPLSDGTSAPIERDNLARGDSALLLFHTPTKSMLLCDEGHKCIALASLTWEETGADGKLYAYAAQLVSADKIDGTVTVTKDGKKETGKFSLARKK